MPTITTPLNVTGNATYTIEADDIYDVDGDAAIVWGGTNTAVIIDNFGFISDTSKNSLMVDGLPTGTLIFNNKLGATVDVEMKFEDLAAGATVTINNDGLMSGRDKNAIELSAAGATFIINNNATGVITQDDPNSDIIKNMSNTTINNHGKIISSGDIMGPDGQPASFEGNAIDFDDDGINNTIHNFAGGLIEGSQHGITGKFGVMITNDAGGIISGRNGAGVNFDNDAEEANLVTVINHGVILGNSRTYEDSDGDAIDTDGQLMLDNYGFVGGMGANGLHDGGINHAEGIAAGGGTINNHVGGVIYSVQRAIQIDNSEEGDAPAAVKITNDGTIQGLDGGAIVIVGEQEDKLVNSGTILGDITMGGGDDTVTFKKGSNVVGDIMLGDGNDTFKGAASDEMIFGDAGVDKLTGGAGSDTFFFATGDSGKSKNAADTILDFNAKDGDMFDLTGIDANRNKAEDQAFKFIGDDKFHDKAGELRFVTEKSDTWLQGDTNGDGKADFMIHLDDAMKLKVDHFDL